MTDKPATGAVVVYGCLCSDAADTLDQAPDRCPGHDRPRLAHWINPGLPGGVAQHHDCPSDYRCPSKETR